MKIITMWIVEKMTVVVQKAKYANLNGAVQIKNQKIKLMTLSFEPSRVFLEG